LAAQNAEAALMRHDESIDLRLEQAKAAKIAAYDNADTQAMIKADQELAKATYQKAESDRWKAEQHYRKEQMDLQQKQIQQQQEYEQQQYEQDSVVSNEEAENWLASNPWFDGNSEAYDQKLASIAQAYSLALEQEYISRGDDDKIFTQEYFDDIDHYMNERYFKQEQQEEQITRQPKAAPRVQPQPSRMNLNMKPVRQNLAPVGKTVKQAAPPNPNRVVLSAEERAFAKQMNIKPEEYAKYKLQIAKSGKYNYEQYRR
jgi:hypothetical protein